VSGRGRRVAALDRMVRRMERPESVAATSLTAPDILAAMTDPDLFGREFGGPSWAPWRAFLAAFFGLPLDAEQLALYRAHTGREAPPATPSREAWVSDSSRPVTVVVLLCSSDPSKVWGARSRHQGWASRATGARRAR